MPLRFAIIGDPVEHSLSPLLHGTAFTSLGVDATYVRLRISREELPEIWSRRLREELDGFNVTLPLKEAVLPFLDEVESAALAVGAVNTVRRAERRFIGTNTDVTGIQHTLSPLVGALRNRPVAVIGAGGTARSVVAALAADVRPSRLIVVAREPERAAGVAALASKLLSCPVEIVRIHSNDMASALAEAHLIVQTTPVGMLPEPTRDPVPGFTGFHREQVVFDVIYRPLQTAFLRRAAQAGCRVLTGLDLFLQQGAASFQLWTGRPMPLDAVRPAILTALSV